MATRPWDFAKSEQGMMIGVCASLAAADTSEVLDMNASKPLAGCVQLSGTFGGAVTLQHSNDGVTWSAVPDRANVDIAPTAAALTNFSTAARYLRLLAAAGVADVTATVVLRG